MKKLGLYLLTLVGFIGACQAQEVIPINDFKIKSYLGTWYEVARLPNSFEDKCIAPITASYSINPKNEQQIIVINQCNTLEGKLSSATGIAKFVESPNIGKLEVSFLPKFLRWLPFGYGDYWILNVNYETIAVVGSPDRKYLWVLARSDKVDKKSLDNALDIAAAQGFDTSKLIFNYLPMAESNQP